MEHVFMLASITAERSGNRFRLRLEDTTQPNVICDMLVPEVPEGLRVGKRYALGLTEAPEVTTAETGGPAPAG